MHLFTMPPSACEQSAASSRKTCRHRRKDGFSLLEVIMAGGVLAFALCSAILVIQSSVREIGIAKNTTVISQAMQNEMDRLRLMSWNEISALPSSATVDMASTYTSTTVATNLTITRSIADVSGFGSPSTLKQITLQANWTSLRGLPQTRTFILRYSKNGLYDYYYNGSS